MNVFMPVFVIVSIIFVSGSVVAESNDENLCKSSEIEVASCQLEGRYKKIISICASEQKELVSYYFGTKNKIELNVEFSSGSKIYRWRDAATYVTFIGFNRNEYSYVFGIPQETFGAKAFLLVKKSKDPLDFNSPRLCTSNSFGEKSLQSSAIEDVDDKTVRSEGFLFPPD